MIDAWRERLAGAEAGRLELPVDRPRTGKPSGPLGRCTLELPAALVPRLRGLDEDLSVVGLAAFTAWLVRLTGHEDVPVAWMDRDLTVMRVQLAAVADGGTPNFKPSFTQLLQHVRATVKQNREQAVSWSSLVAAAGRREEQHAALRPEARTGPENPFTEVLFEHRRADHGETRQAAHDLEVALVTPADAAPCLQGSYKTELFDPATIENLLASFARLLAAVAATPSARLADLEMVSDGQWQLLDAWNGAARTEAPLGRSLAELFQRTVETYPERPAVSYGEVCLNYRQLDERARRLAHHLRANSVRPGDLVAVCLERSPELITSFVAIILAGAAYAPLDPTYPAERLVWMAEDTATPVLITDKVQAARLPIDELTAQGCRVLYVEELFTAPVPEQEPPLPRVGPEYPAYVIYTSGSTGRPKGVVIPQRAVARLVFGGRYYEFGPDERIAQASNTSFDVATLEIWAPLLHGGHMVGIDRETLLSAERLRVALERLRPTVLWLTASLFHQYARQVPDLLAHVGTLMFGGERCDPDAVRASMAQGSTVHINGYGPTEATTFTTCYRVPEVPPGATSVPIGYPIGNTEVLVLDRWQRPAPIGAAGELVVGGPGLAQCYHRRPSLTAGVFIPHPCSARLGHEQPGARVYRTGDLVRWLPSGVLDYIGRIDHQVKVRGFRVELGEIEAQLGQHPAIKERAVVMQDDGRGSKRLVAYVVIDTPAAEPDVAAPSVEELREFLGQSMPAYLVPTGFQFLDELPLNANGKVDRRALPAFDFEHAGVSETDLVEPRNDLERQTAALWCEVLGAERVGVETSFFALGGHSLLATQLLARVRDTLGLELSLHEIFEHPTVAALARRIEALQAAGTSTASALPPIPRLDPTRPAPLSFGQRRLWFLSQLELSSALYNIPSAFELRGDLDVQALDRALADVARRHAVLRTRYGSRDGEPVALVDAPRRWHLEIVDLSGLDDTDRQRKSRALVAQEAGAPFDLERDAVWRTRLLRTGLKRDGQLRAGTELHVLILNIHHIATDGWSQDLIAREMSQLYAVFHQGQASPLPEPELQYADFAAWQASWLEEAEQQRLVRYWRRQLDGLEPADLPADRPRPRVQQADGALHVVTLPAELSDCLRGLARQHGETLFTVLLAAFYVLFARFSSRHDLAVGTPSAGRYRTEFEKLVGLFANTLVLRLDLAAGEHGNRTFADLLANTRQTVVGAQIHQALPFERLVQELEPTRDAARTPFFQVLFQVLAMELAPSLPGLDQRPLHGHSGTAKFDVEVTIFDRAEGLRVSVEYATALFDATTIERLFDAYRLLLQGVLDRPELPLWRLPLVPAADRQLIDLVNRTERPLPDSTLHALVALQAARTPEQSALITEGVAEGPSEETAESVETLTYAELWRRVQRLAALLRRRGVTPEEPVAVCLPRTPELVVALLAVLEAGASYLPLDPSYPPQRLAFMVQDTRARRVLSHRTLVHLFDELVDKPSDETATGPELMFLDELELTEPTAGAATTTTATAPAASRVDPRQRAYFIYTSGSTGRPKGVEISHRNAVAMLTWAARIFPPDELAGVAAVTSVCFDLSIYELFLPLTQGGTVILARDALHLLEHPARERVTLINTVPSAIAELAAAEGIPDSARVVNLGGEPLRRALVDQVYAASKATKIYNLYGPSEDTTYSTYKLVSRGQHAEPTIGGPIDNTRVHVLDARGEPVPIGVVGELMLAGEGVTRAYLGRPGLTAERYLPNPFGEGAKRDANRDTSREGSRLYRTGDRARWRADGDLEVLGRLDHQVKLHGYRIELGEIESALQRHSAVTAAAVLMRGQRLVAYVATRTGEPEGGHIGPPLQPDPETGSDREAATDAELRDFVAGRLPSYMVPAVFDRLDELPLTPNGKIDRKALALRALPDEQHETAAGAPPANEAEAFVAELWRQVLGLDIVPADKNFFDLGGHSLLLPRLHLRLKQRWPRVRILDLLQHTTVRRLAGFLGGPEGDKSPAAGQVGSQARLSQERHQPAAAGSANGRDIAIVAVAGRFPHAPDIDALWQCITDGVEAIERFDREQLLQAGEDPERLEDPDYVPAGTQVDHIRDFDAAFFDFGAREAALTDPQQRLLLECAWEALERAGWAGDTYPGEVGVFAGTGGPGYLVKHLLTRPEILHQQGEVQSMIATGPDFTATRVAYKLGLRGPAVSVQTACSTSLVAVHLACQSLLSGDCDMALAGGCTLQIPHGVGYLHVADSIASPDGHCRAFDARAGGTVESSGAGMVVLKRLADARADGDPIVAVIKGTAINNDGNVKVGYTAPSVEGQTRVIVKALQRAGVAPASLGYVECHGTGTVLGDPIEVDALRRAYSEPRPSERSDEADGAPRARSIALSSFKTQVGHMDTAAGVGGLIRAALALQHRQIPPNLHFQTPNPELDLETSPFYVPAETRPWPAGETPRRAAVSAFGIGGTNAHVILEEAPAEPTATRLSRPMQLLRLSARTVEALEAGAAHLAQHLGAQYLEAPADLDLADIAFTLHCGRKAFEHRLTTVVDAADPAQAVQHLRGLTPRARQLGQLPPSPPSVVFLFPGQGTQHAGMARQLYANENLFRRELDEGCALLEPLLGIDLRELILATADTSGYTAEEYTAEDAQRRLETLDLGQPALFLVEYALARLWQSWGVEPRAMLGHSLGELVAATLAGVFDRDTALRLVAARGRLMASTPTGAMLAVTRPAAEVEARLRESGMAETLSLATVNSPSDCVVAGTVAAIEAFEAKLSAEEIETRRLHMTTAAHSLLMEPILDAYRAEVERAAPRTPERPFVSCVTGRWIEPTEAASIDFWTRHLRQPVRFGDSLQRLFELHQSEPGGVVLLELGPGHTLSTLVRRNESQELAHPVIRTLPHPRDETSDLAQVLEAVGRLWLLGVDVDPDAFWAGQERRRVVLPTYPFERQRCWIEPGRRSTTIPGMVPAEDAVPGPRAPGPVEPARTPDAPLLGGTAAAVADAWRELLGLETVDPDAEFLDLGGHSLLATQLAHLLRRRFGVEVRATEILGAAPTVAEQAALIDARRPSTGELTKVPRDRPLPLSDSQERLWLLARLGADGGDGDGGSAAYNLPVVLHLHGQLDAGALTRALAELARRHEVLRTAFVLDGGKPVQRIEEPGPVEVPVIDLRRIRGAETIVRRQTLRDLARPMDLAQAPLWRARLWHVREEAADDESKSTETCYLGLTMHHSILDGWSGRVLFRDLAALYNQASGADGQAASRLPELPIQYADYAAWQRRRLDEAGKASAPGQDGLAPQLEYWRRQLAGAPPILELPLDRARPSVHSFRGRRLTFSVPGSVLAGLRTLARQAKATMFPVVLAAFQLLLARWSGQWDVCVGTPVANREEPRTQELIGFFVNTVVLRTVIDPNSDFARLVARVKEVVSGGFANQELPFERLVSELRPQRDAGVNPLFQVMLVFHNTPPVGDDFAGIPFEMLEPDSETSHFDLTLSLEEQAPAAGSKEGNGKLAGLVDFSTDLFETDTIERLIDGFQTLLAAVASQADGIDVAALPVMSPAEAARVVVEWNATAVDWRQSLAVPEAAPQDCLHDLVLRQAERRPHAIAVEAADGRLSYGHLVRRARALAARLRRTGVAPGDLVGVTLPGSCNAMVAIVAIHLAGAAYLPLDPGAPAERQRQILEDNGCRVLIGTVRLTGYKGRLVPPRAHSAPATPLPTSPNAGFSPDYPAYVITTSGSTGRPKGVAVSHRSAVNLAFAFVQHHGLREDHRFLAIPPLHFDASVGDHFPAWAAGACLIFHPAPGRLTGERLDRFCTRRRVSVIDTAVALWKAWLDDWLASQGWASQGMASQGRARGRKFVLPDLEVMMVGGEAVNTRRLATWAQLAPPRARVFNHYGPTEATVCATSYPTRDGSEVTRPALPIGAPLPNVRAYVLDARLRPQPASVVGELCLGGAGIALGYLRLPARTAEVFVPDPFARDKGGASFGGNLDSHPGGRLYRTGDLARWLPVRSGERATGTRGVLEFLGRRDRQVKIRGFRIELGEIEAALQRHPEVASAVVVAFGEGAAAQLVGYVVARSTDATPPALDILRTFLADHLPAYMVPSTIVPLETLPLTPNGKVDLRALPTPTVGTAEPVAPRTPLEAQLLEIWRDLLVVSELGVEDDFFAAGGSSLLAMQLASRMQLELRLEIPLTKLFEATTVAAFARVVEALRAGETQTLDLRARAVLDPAIQPTRSHPEKGRRTGTGVLVTGGTGFLGAYLIDELLRARDGDIYILVRADDIEAGRQRIRRNLEGYGLWSGIESRGDAGRKDAARLVPVLGDLGQPRLGLDADAFARLAAQLGELHHNAAAVDFVRPYSALEAINVHGTEEVLRLASLDGARPVHFVSTLGLFLQPVYEGKTITEDDAPSPDDLDKGYEQSKWVAEQLCEQARERGLPVNILRPARVSGAASTGAANTQDLFYSWIKGCVQLGLAPNIEHAIDLMPVDYLAKAIVSLATGLATDLGSGGRAYHFYNRRTLPFRELARWVDVHVQPLRLVPYDEWVTALRSSVAAQQENALAAFLALFGDTLEEDRQPTFEQRHSQTRLQAAGLVCPPADGALLTTYFAYLERTGFLRRTRPAAPTLKLPPLKTSVPPV